MPWAWEFEIFVNLLLTSPAIQTTSMGGKVKNIQIFLSVLVWNSVFLTYTAIYRGEIYLR